MKLLNQLKYRIAFSILIGFAYALTSMIWTEKYDFSILLVFTVAVLVFIPLTILWAIISTFFMDDETKSSDEIIDK